jgi:NifB/MoaA-like Fe-S oxidoreductase
MPHRRIAIATGTRMAPVLEPLAMRLSEHSGATVEVIAIENGYFGPTVTTAGLLPGRDVAEQVRQAGDWDIVLVPAESLNDDARFIDDVSLVDLEAALAPAAVRPAHEITSALAAA